MITQNFLLWEALSAYLEKVYVRSVITVLFFTRK